MMKITSLDEGLEVFKALGSEVRLGIILQLASHGEMSLGELAESLELTAGGLTAHVKKLCSLGLISVREAPTGHGLAKLCSLAVPSLLLDVEPKHEGAKYSAYETEIAVGHYSDYDLSPDCGLADRRGLIGQPGDPRPFAFPNHLEADLVYFHDGYIEYRIPNLLPKETAIVQLTLSFEISSAEQGLAAGRPEEIGFRLNGQSCGAWRSQESTDTERGIHTPVWYREPVRRHGYLKMLVINNRGVFLDGAKIADYSDRQVLIDDKGEIRFRFETLSPPGEGGGLALYGRSFGNYRQNIRARIHYISKDPPLGEQMLSQ